MLGLSYDPNKLFEGTQLHRCCITVEMSAGATLQQVMDVANEVETSRHRCLPPSTGVHLPNAYCNDYYSI